ncbi:MAG TPA: hypothetical protein VHA82_08135 [Ramlibacter sp.]|uniref:hypothetical protein n=1 Tax=Ramlibacter sp. TaxID=1917967 RepID=UPI002CCF60B1|nr:hypothetical protein [Ramlibacter sp.]HVZ43764.1 hypothetical protein [Ramlibacter sp.]
MTTHRSDGEDGEDGERGKRGERGESAEDGEARIGIFRRAAVLRYSQPVQADTPEMLAPRRAGLPALGIALALSAAVLAWLLQG